MSHRRFRIAACVVAAVALTGVAPSAAEPPVATPLAAVGSLEGEYVPGELVVGFRASSSQGQMSAALEQADITGARDLALDHTMVVNVAGDSMASVMEDLRRQPGVEFVEPNYIYRADATPNDVSYGNLWGLHNTGQSVLGVTGTADADIDAPEAWDLTTGSTSVVVAIADSGIDYNHPDLAGNIWSNPGETGGNKEFNGVDDDGNGFIDDWRGWDFASDDNDPRDLDLQVGHGTHVAGTIGARGNNAGALTGVNWSIGLVGLRVFDVTGSATNAAVADAFNYAGDMGIRVVNFSGGGPSFSAAIETAINSHQNTLYVVAAGNSGLNLDNPGSANNAYPCEYTSTNLICVAASTQNDTRAGFSNYSSTSVDIAAPGESIWSLAPATNLLYSETFTTDPFASRWSKGANAGVNAWNAEPAYSPVGLAPSLSDGSPYTGQYAANSDTWVQTTTAFSLAGQFECYALFTMYLDVNTAGGDVFRVWARSDTAFNNSNYEQGWYGTGFVDNVVDLNAFNGGPVYLRLGLFSDGVAEAGYDGVYVDNIEGRCLSNTYSSGGNSNLRPLSGTSMATPHVAGAAGLVLSRNSSLTTTQLRDAILTTGDVKPAFQGNVTTTGRRLNVFGAVNAAAPIDTNAPTISITTPANGASYNVGQTVNADYSCNDTGGSGLASCNGPVADGSPIDTATAGTKTFTVNAADGAGNPATSTRTYTVATVPPTGGPPTGSANFTSLTPARLLDTRPGAPIAAGGTADLVVTGRDGVPADGVAAVLVNLTVTNTEADGYLTTWPKGEGRPNASSLNFAGGQTVANLVLAKVGANGSISIWNSNDSPDMRSVDVIVDVVGYFPGSAAIGALTPARALDTRSAGKLGAGGSLDLVLLGQKGIPSSGVGAVVLNLTVTNTEADGYLTTWPKGEGRPNASSLNFAAGQTVANLVVAKVGANGSISIWNSNDSPDMAPTNVLVDVVGWIPTGASFGSLTPDRILDTRSLGALTPGATIELPVLNRGGVPATGVGAVVLNLTATGTNAAGYLTTWPTGVAKPNASSLNFAAGQTVANLVVAKVGANGSISIWNSNDSPDMAPTNVLVDVVGWFAA